MKLNIDTVLLAQQLLGKELIHHIEEGTTAGIIVETEAYLHNDRACHAYHRRTTANEAMFCKAGTIYVYNIYGMYQCFNIVSNQKNIGEAVLIRALQPTQGISIMQNRRLLHTKANSKKIFNEKELCSGPSKLCQAMAFTKSHSFLELNKQSIELGKQLIKRFNIHTTTRIGITKGNDEHLPYRFYIKGNPYISKA